jgi:hypothetical protein
MSIICGGMFISCISLPQEQLPGLSETAPHEGVEAHMYSFSAGPACDAPPPQGVVTADAPHGRIPAPGPPAQGAPGCMTGPHGPVHGRALPHGAEQGLPHGPGQGWVR